MLGIRSTSRSLTFLKTLSSQNNMTRSFPHIVRWIRDLRIEFIFTELIKCNLHMVWEFYANQAPEARSHYVIVRGRNLPISPTYISDILGTLQETYPLMFIGLNIRHPYKSIQHTLCGSRSMAQWTKHTGKRYHESLIHCQVLQQMNVWFEIQMKCIKSGLHYIDITQHDVMIGTNHNIGVIVIPVMCNTLKILDVL